MQCGWRVACVRIPRFPIGAVWEGEAERGGRRPEDRHQFGLFPENDGVPNPISAARGADAAESLGVHWDERLLALAVGAARSTARRLRVVTAAAGRAGVRAGMTVAEARAACASLVILDWDDTALARAITRTSADFLTASPHVTPVAGSPGTWWVGAAGFDDLGGERALAEALLALAQRWHADARVAIADSCVAARVGTWERRTAARAARSTVLVPPGGDAAYLASAPLGLIPMDEEMRVALAALGMTTAGQLAALAAEDVEQRWGANGLSSWRLARGDDPRRPVLTRAESRRAVAVELPAPVETTEPVIFVVRAALERLAAELVADGKAAAAIAITLTLDAPASALPSGGRAHTMTREVRPARPLARVPQLVELCRALLEGWSLTAPVCGVEVAIVALAPAAGEQGHLLDTSWRDPSAAHAAFTRLRAELGAGVVVRPRMRDEHRPEHRGHWVEADAAPASTPAAPAEPNERTRAMRLLESPELVEVEMPGGVPVAAWWRGTRVALASAAGPERLSGDWWRDPYRRDYWRCDAEEGGTVLLYHDRTAECWYVQGWED